MTIPAFLRSPLLHFFLLGGLVFGVYSLKNPPMDDGPGEDVIRLTDAEADRLADGFLAAWGRAPTAEEARSLVRDWAVEEAMVREARALGLDQGDAMIRNRLRAKMEFLAEAPAAAREPDEDTLRAYYAENAERYARPARLSFAQVLLPGGTSPDEAKALLANLEQGADPGAMGRATQLPPRIDDMAAPAVDRVFGAGFGTAAGALPLRTWAGPLESTFGVHLVRLDTRSDSDLPPFEMVRDRVLADWRSDQARQMREAFTGELMKRYRLELPGAAETRP